MQSHAKIIGCLWKHWKHRLFLPQKVLDWIRAKKILKSPATYFKVSFLYRVPSQAYSCKKMDRLPHRWASPFSPFNPFSPFANGKLLRKNAWASVFHLKRQYIYSMYMHCICICICICIFVHIYIIYIHSFAFRKYIYTRKTKLTENGSLFSFVGKWQTVINVCYFSKRAHLQAGQATQKPIHEVSSFKE